MENFSKYAFPKIKKALVINYISKYQEKRALKILSKHTVLKIYLTSFIIIFQKRFLL